MATANINPNAELQGTLDRIRANFRNIKVTKENLQKPTAEFTTTFYYAYLNEIKLMCHQLFPCIDVDDITSQCPSSMDHERYVFIFIKYILNKIEVTYFTLMDFLQPNAKRTQTSLKFMMLFFDYAKTACLGIKESVDKLIKAVEEKQATDMRISSKKEEMSELSKRIGLSMEKLEKLEKEYNTELKLQSTLSEKEAEMDEEIENLRKEEQALTASINAQLTELENVNKEIEVLSNEIVTEEEYEVCASNLKEIEKRIEEQDKLTIENEQIIRDNHTQVDYYKNCMSMLQQIDLSCIEKTKKIENLNQQVAKNDEELLNFQKQKKNLQKELEIKKQNLLRNDEEFLHEKHKLEKMYKQAGDDEKRLKEELKSKMVLHNKLSKEFNKYKEDLENSEKECEKLAEEQKKLKDFHQDFYKKMTEQQDILVNHFNSNIQKVLEKSLKE